jgi:hypothetical protein
VQAVIRPCVWSARLITLRQIQGCSVSKNNFFDTSQISFKQNCLTVQYTEMLPYIEWKGRILTYPRLLFLAMHQEKFNSLSIARKSLTQKLLFVIVNLDPLCNGLEGHPGPGSDSATLFSTAPTA